MRKSSAKDLAMRPLLADADFAEILIADRAIVFIDFAWSGQSMLTAAVIEEWERTSNIWGLDCPVFKVRPDELRTVADWMPVHTHQLAGEGVYGSLVWLRSGAIVDKSLTMAAQFPDVALPQAHERDQLVPLPDGDYICRVVQLFDPNACESAEGESSDFVILLSPSTRPVQQWSEIPWLSAT
jgi:hypothetical protein